MQPVVLNNTPLVSLWLLRQFDLLQQLYNQVYIPRAVYQEFLAADTHARQQGLQSAPWIQIVDLAIPNSWAAYTGLDRGEAEVIALAVEQNASLIVIDERKARRYAARLNLPLTGTLGVLLDAKARGFTNMISPHITKLQEAGIHLHPSLIAKVLQLSGEGLDN